MNCRFLIVGGQKYLQQTIQKHFGMAKTIQVKIQIQEPTIMFLKQLPPVAQFLTKQDL